MLASIASAAGHLRDALREFFPWWALALRSLVPTAWYRAWRNRKSCLILEWGSGGVALNCRKSGRETRLFRGHRDKLPQALAEDRARAIRSVFVTLGTELAFRRTMLLPRAAEANLARLMANEIDRQTPFPAVQVYFDYRISQRDTCTQQLVVELVVAKRTIVDELQRLVEMSGHTLAGVGVAGFESTATSGLLTRWSGTSGGRFGWLNGSLAAAAVILAVACMVQALENLDNDIAGLTAQVARARAEAQQADALRREVGRLIEASSFLTRRKAEPSPLALLRETTILLPDSAWTYEFQLTGRSLRLAGYAADAPDLIARFDKAQLLTNSQFRAPVARVANRNLDRFDLSLDLRPGAAGGRP